MMISESETRKAFCSEMNTDDISKQKIGQVVLERKLEKEGGKERRRERRERERREK